MLKITFTDGAKVEIGKGFSSTYRVKFTNADTGHIVFETTLNANSWAKAGPRYYVNWLVEVFSVDGKKILEQKLNLENKDVVIYLTSKSLGDTVAWIPYVEEFRKKHNCSVYVATFWNNILASEYPELKFVEMNHPDSVYIASYHIGCFEDINRNKNNWRSIPLQQVASDYLGLEFTEIVPDISCGHKPIETNQNYVVLHEFSTFQGKEWLYQDGWERIINYLHILGYKTASISKEPTKLPVDFKWNNRSIEQSIDNLANAKALISIASGPIWLSYALEVPTIVISNFTDPISEMTNCIRVYNHQFCHGCYNDITRPFERNFAWCPRGKNYECSRAITPKQVMAAIDKILPRIESEVLNYSDEVAQNAVEVIKSNETIVPENKRVLFIAPHLSTGGMPEYLLNSVEELLETKNKVAVIEYNDISKGAFVVQKDQLCELVDVYTLDCPDNQKLGAVKIIFEQFKPEIVHFQEFPESFLGQEVADWIYKQDRDYKIIETTHGKEVLTVNAKINSQWQPDAYVFVSWYHGGLFENEGYKLVFVIEHEVHRTKNIRKRILCVGLFAPWKNQEEAFRIARELPEYDFDFIGNLASNFEYYWKPLLAAKPANVNILGEQNNVRDFYTTSDLLLFASTNELNPLVPKEALAFGLPVIMHNLDTYCGAYDDVDNVYLYNTKEDAIDFIKAILSPHMAKKLNNCYNSL